MINNLMKLTPYFKKIFNYCNFRKDSLRYYFKNLDNKIITKL